jgi:hypothetical protein
MGGWGEDVGVVREMEAVTRAMAVELRLRGNRKMQAREDWPAALSFYSIGLLMLASDPCAALVSGLDAPLDVRSLRLEEARAEVGMGAWDDVGEGGGGGEEEEEGEGEEAEMLVLRESKALLLGNRSEVLLR